MLNWRHLRNNTEATSGYYTEAPSDYQAEFRKSDRMATDSSFHLDSQRPMRADARRNYDKLIAAAREAFTEHGSTASLEDIARRAGVGIGTLYRHFPTRQDLLEAVYEEEVEAICALGRRLRRRCRRGRRSTGWLHRFVGYAATKQALAEELHDYVDRRTPRCSARCREAIERHRRRAAGAREGVGRRPARRGRSRTSRGMVVSIATIRSAEPEQIERILDLALDGLRYRPAAT